MCAVDELNDVTCSSTMYAAFRHARQSSRRRAIPSDDERRPCTIWPGSACPPCRQSADTPPRWMAPSRDRCQRSAMRERKLICEKVVYVKNIYV